MDRQHRYISTLLERLPKWELRTYENQVKLDKLRNRISTCTDIQTELRNLYKVNGFADFALTLMWIADKVSKDPTLEESTMEEENMVFDKFRQAVGDLSEAVSEESLTPVTQSTAPESSQEIPEFDSVWNMAGQGVPLETGGGAFEGSEEEIKFSKLLDRFLEAIQGASDNRADIMVEVMNECNKVLSSATITDDYREFCRLLSEFLKFVSDNQFIDDIRVMNIISNIQDPFMQWTRTAPDQRAGLLDGAIEILRDFKTMFE